MPLTAKQILSSSFPNVKKASTGVVIHKDTFEPQYITERHKLGQRNPKLIGTQFLSVTTSSLTTGPEGKAKRSAPQKYKTVVRGSTSKDQLYLGNVIVACECDYFTYTCEVALNKRGAAQIKQSNGEHPEITNPRLVPTPCKHLHAVLEQIVRKKVGKA
jgi:hypothetical protein